MTRSRALAWARLLRAPNVVTAVADLGLGVLVAGPREVGAYAAVALALASALLYCAGMVWNDYFDIEQDRRERPNRPLPSGEIPPGSARSARHRSPDRRVALRRPGGLGRQGPPGMPAVLGAVLVGAVLLYDAWLKRTRFGPIGMGVCRFLYVLLGLSAVGPEVVPWGCRVHPGRDCWRLRCGRDMVCTDRGPAE